MNDEHLVKELLALYPQGARPNDGGLSGTTASFYLYCNAKHHDQLGKLLAVSTLLKSLQQETDEKIVLGRIETTCNLPGLRFA